KKEAADVVQVMARQVPVAGAATNQKNPHATPQEVANKELTPRTPLLHFIPSIFLISAAFAKATCGRC
ncbi:MAG: hypothetical protein QXK43_08245, partial [Candidatus Jordarchaeales archaeon]